MSQHNNPLEDFKAILCSYKLCISSSYLEEFIYLENEYNFSWNQMLSHLQKRCIISTFLLLLNKVKIF